MALCFWNPMEESEMHAFYLPNDDYWHDLLMLSAVSSDNSGRMLGRQKKTQSAVVTVVAEN